MIMKKMTEEHKGKIGLANAPLMKKLWQNPEYRKRQNESHKGKIPVGLALAHTPEAIKKMIETKKKNPTRYWLGKKRSVGDIEKIRIGHLGKNTGEKNYNWKGGILPLVRIIRNSTKYKEWRNAIFKRDNYTCQITKKRSKKDERIILNAHHIKPFSRIVKENNIKSYADALNCKEFWDLNNGITILAELNPR